MTLPTSFRAAALILAAACGAGLASGCSSHYYADPDGRFHIEMPMSMNVGTTSKGNVRMEPDNDTVITITVHDTDANGIDDYVQTTLDAAALAHGDSNDLSIAGLPARRLEFRGGIDLGGGLPVAPNLVAYLILDAGRVFALTCSGEDGPFEIFCIGPFDDMVMTFGTGAPPK